MAALDPDLLALLACPAPDHGRLVLDGQGSLTCAECGRRYPVEHDGPVPIPVLLLDEAGQG